jgi:hypothetical protein
MSDPQRLRESARNCRRLAKSARNRDDAALLQEIAVELEAEADKSEGEQRRD